MPKPLIPMPKPVYISTYYMHILAMCSRKPAPLMSCMYTVHCTVYTVETEPSQKLKGKR